MIPLRDVIPTRTWPFVTVTLIVLNAVVFLHEQTLGRQGLELFVRQWGLVPADFAWDRSAKTGSVELSAASRALASARSGTRS